MSNDDDLDAAMHYRAETGDPTLDNLIGLAFAIGYAAATQGELRVPVLAYHTEDGTLRCHDLWGYHPHPADVAAVLLAAHDATHAAICFESWQVDVPFTPETQARVEAGEPPIEVSPSQHPDRIDALLVLAEAKGGRQHWRRWLIRRDPLGEGRILTEDRDARDNEPQPSRFTPLFKDKAELRAIVRDYHAWVTLQQRAQSRN